MTGQSDWNLTEEELAAPTDEECQAITDRRTDAARKQFMEAATALTFAKIRSGDRTPWRDLVEAHRQTEPVRVEVEVVTEDGIPRPQIAYIERGYGLKGNDALMFDTVGRLKRALDAIEDERETARKNGSGGGRPTKDASSRRIAVWLNNRGYADSLNKKSLVSDAMEHFDVGKTKVTDAIREHGLTRSRVRKR